jgi:TonB family protein
VIRGANLAARDCYWAQNPAATGVAGKIITKFVIGHDGRVQKASVAKNTTANTVLAACVLHVVKRLEFPELSQSGPVEISYPWIFKVSDSQS